MRPRATDVGLDAKCPATARESLQPRISYICNSSRSSDEPRGNEACNPSPTNSSLSAGDRYSHALFLNIGTGNVWGSPEFISCCRFPSPLPVGGRQRFGNWSSGLPTVPRWQPSFYALYGKAWYRVTPARQATEYAPYRPGPSKCLNDQNPRPGFLESALEHPRLVVVAIIAVVFVSMALTTFVMQDPKPTHDPLQRPRQPQSNRKRVSAHCRNDRA
jgi:hypothetical protein